MLAEEHGDLCTTLATIGERLAQVDDEARALAAAIQTDFGATTSDVTTSTLDALEEHNRKMRAAISQVIDLLDAQSEVALDSPLGSVQAAVDAYLRRHAARQKRELDLLGLSW